MWKFLKWEKNVNIEILIWHMIGWMVKKWVRQGFIFHAIIPANYNLH